MKALNQGRDLKNRKFYLPYKKNSCRLFFATTSSSVGISNTDFGRDVLPISTGITFGLTFTDEVVFEINNKKCNKFKKPHERTQQTFNPFDKLYRECLPDNVFGRKEFESLCNIFHKLHQRG